VGPLPDSSTADPLALLLTL